MTTAATGTRGTCVLCGVGGGEVVVREGPWSGRACACGTVYVDPRPQVDAALLTCDLHVDSDYAALAPRRASWIADLRPAGTILDVGCGRGHVLSRLSAQGWKATGLEPNRASAAAARARGLEVIETFAEEYAGRADHARFDVVWHVDLLSHFEDPAASLRAMASLLEPRGIVAFEVGLFGGLPRWCYPWIGRPGFPAHLWFFSHRAVLELLDRAGLRLVRARRFAVLPSTVVSTLARKALGRVVERPRRDDGAAGDADATWSLYARAHDVLRYDVGGWLPKQGPCTAFFAAVAQDGGAA